MTIAQRLYESGYITYMRTDSVNISDEARKKINSQIEKSYGEEYLKPRKFKVKKKSFFQVKK